MLKRDIEKLIYKELRPQKVILIYGARRVGKTVITEQIADTYRGTVQILNGEDASTAALLGVRTAENYNQLLQGCDLLIVDEAQTIPDIGQILKLIVDTVKHVSVIASGSSSLDLQQKSGEPLVGRSYEYRLYPFSVSEMLQQESRIDHVRRIEEHLTYGSYPELTSIPEFDRKQAYLRELVRSYLLKDILSYDGIKNSQKVMDLLRLLAYQVGQEVSLEELSVRLSLSRNTVEKYIDLLCKTFVIYRLPAFARNARREVSKPGKIYFMDNGIRNAVIDDFRPFALRQDVGALWENYLIGERIRRSNNSGIVAHYYFWRTYTGQEIDLIEEIDHQLHAFEFKWGERMPQAPSAFANAYPDATYQVVNRTNYLGFCL